MKFLYKNWLYLIGGSILLYLMWYFSEIVTYLLIAWVLSLLGQPLMRFFTQKVRIGRFQPGKAVAALLTIATFYTILFGILMIFVPTLIAQANQLANLDYQAVGQKFQGLFSWLDIQGHTIGMLKPGESLAAKLQESLAAWFRPSMVSDMVGAVVSAFGSFIVVLSSVTFILFFFLEEESLFASIVHAVVPTHSEGKVLQAMDESSTALTDYFKGLLIQLGSFSLMATTFLWVLGVPNALLIGIAGGLLNIVPYVGPIIGLIFGWFITISSGLQLELNDLGMLLLKVAGAFLTTQAIDNLFLSTIIFSKSVKAHPLEIFVVTLMAAQVGGVTGMVVGIPVYTVIRVIARTFFSQFKIVQLLTEHLDEDTTATD